MVKYTFLLTLLKISFFSTDIFNCKNSLAERRKTMRFKTYFYINSFIFFICIFKVPLTTKKINFKNIFCVAFLTATSK